MSGYSGDPGSWRDDAAKHATGCPVCAWEKATGNTAPPHQCPDEPRDPFSRDGLPSFTSVFLEAHRKNVEDGTVPFGNPTGLSGRLGRGWRHWRYKR
jgi:hypothetical protein